MFWSQAASDWAEPRLSTSSWCSIGCTNIVVVLECCHIVGGSSWQPPVRSLLALFIALLRAAITLKSCGCHPSSMLRVCLRKGHHPKTWKNCEKLALFLARPTSWDGSWTSSSSRRCLTHLLSLLRQITIRLSLGHCQALATGRGRLALIVLMILDLMLIVVIVTVGWNWHWDFVT